jgi:hypothetical protein
MTLSVVVKYVSRAVTCQPFGQKFLFGIQFIVGGIRKRNKSVKY